ncbi:MAG: ABC transporter substrate-binding protein [Oceanospirillaceae bacterium]|nr:ABC transporter substrate-binding protein [Oceanospirillaceae bacterium]
MTPFGDLRSIRLIPTYILLTLSLTTGFFSQLSHGNQWQKTLDQAAGDTVYWHAWGGDTRTNDFISWVGEQTDTLYGVKVQQVKLSSTSEAVTQVLAEKAAAQDEQGAVDMIWINGPNFLAMKQQNLLHGPFVKNLPNARYLDLSAGSAATVDFTEAVNGLEVPWRLARFVFIVDSDRVENPPQSMSQMLTWAQQNPGRLTHPIVSNFMGTTFLKQALIELTPDTSVLQQEASKASFEKASAPLWAWYDAIKPFLWREGTSFPENEAIQQQMLSDGVVDIAMAFDPAAAAAGIASGLLPPSARILVPSQGSLGNISFVAIPYNASHIAAAKVVANFLLQPETQAHMQNIDVLGSFSVLDTKKLSHQHTMAFSSLPTSEALPTLVELGPTLLEPHSSWTNLLKQHWSMRYSQ